MTGCVCLIAMIIPEDLVFVFPFFDGDDVSSKVPYSCRDQRV